MNNDFDSKFGGRSSSDFERKTSSGFASGSFDSGFGSDDSYGSTGSMSFNNNGNDSSSQSGFGGSTYNPEPEYDPNAPLYDPSLDNYDPNAPLYNPSSDFSSQGFSSQSSSQGFASVNTVTLPRQKSKAKIIVIVALGLVVSVIVGIVVYNIAFAKKSIKEYLDTAEGKKVILAFRLQAQFYDEFQSGDVYAEDDDTMVCEIVLKVESLTPSKMDEMDSNMEAQREGVKRQIEEITEKHKIKDFEIVYRYKGKRGNVLKEYTVSKYD